MEYISYIIVAVVAFWIGGHWKAYRVMQNLISRPDDMIELFNKLKAINQDEAIAGEEMPEDAVPLEIEQVNGYVYAYSKTTGEFLAQAHDIEQAARIARQRYPNKTFWHPELKKDTQTA